MSSRDKRDVKKIFEFWCNVCEVRFVDDSICSSATAPTGVMTECFPEGFSDKKMIGDISAFAFPCSFECDSVQLYSFVLTTDDSKWRFGFCRHDPKAKSAMVIITYLPWHDTFLKLMSVLSELRRCDKDDFNSFLLATYNSRVPEPGKDVKIFYNGGQSHFTFERPLQFQLPSIPKNHNLNLYYNFVDPRNMISVFAAMLAERRIIFTSRRLDRLSSCIQAANAFLYPMVWQHIFIPLLPMKFKDYLSAPMPYLIGVPELVLNTMAADELGEVVILNCDTKIFDSPFDDVHEMPNEIVTQLKRQLCDSNEHIGDRVSKIFLGVLVQLIGGYRDAVEFRDSGKTFNRDKFIESRPMHLRRFLSKMMELQIFQQFIDERLQMLNTGLGFSDEFELETVRYAEANKKRGRNYTFLKNVRDKTNPAVKSAVKSVKEGSRGVKTAYKDLKSKLRDITPPNNSQFHSHLTSNSHHDHIDVCDTLTSRNSHHSAPSSPIISTPKGRNNLANTEYHHMKLKNNFKGMPSKHHLATMTSSSSTNIRTRPATYAHDIANGDFLVATSPAVSPVNSACASEMNLSQELQHHPLFKPPIDKECAMSSLQVQNMQPARPVLLEPCTPSDINGSNDLISLHENNSFDLQDFDPLNHNARLYPVHTRTAVAISPTTNESFNALPNFRSVNQYLNTKISSPLVPMPREAKFSQNDDVELLRKYGLDQFSFDSNFVNSSTSKVSSTAAMTSDVKKWTTFDK